jgi:hypothetical protein
MSDDEYEPSEEEEETTSLVSEDELSEEEEMPMDPMPLEEEEPDERIEVRPLAQSESKVVISKRERKS